MKSLDEMSDYLNPLLVKEVRQLFHSKQYLVLIACFLLGELGVLFVMMLNYKDMSGHTHEELGEIAFGFQCVGLSLAVLIVCMFRTCQLFNKERLDKNLDYTRLCSITPFTVASGKLCSAIVLMLVVTSLILPFMVISYFLRGISLQTIMLWLAILIPQYLVGIQFSIFVGAIGKKGAEALLLLGLAFVMPFMIGTGLSMSFMGRSPKLERAAIVLAAMAIGMFSQAFAWTVAMISRSKSNIMFHPRLCALAICIVYPLLFTLLMAYLPSRGTFSASPEGIFTIVSMLMCIVIGTIQLAFTFEREQPGVRVMAERPRRRLLRAVMFFLSSGRAGGISLSVALMIIWAAFIIVVDHFLTLRMESKATIMVSVYVLFYCLFAVVLNRIFPKVNTIVGFVISVAVWLVLPVVAGYTYAAVANIRDEAVFEMLYTTPLYIFADNGSMLDHLNARLLVPLLPCVLLLLSLAKYIVTEFIHFVRDEEEAA